MNAQYDHAPKSKSNHDRITNNENGIAMPSTVLVHAKLKTTTPGDLDEQEADEMADSIVNGGKIARSVNSRHSGNGISLPSQFGRQLASFQGQGSRLYGDLKSQMETGFGRDFSDVRLHTDESASEMSSSISAKAFTYGNDIYFNRGQFNPDTIEGQRLLAHELTHVIQGSGKVARKKTEEEIEKKLSSYFQKHFIHLDKVVDDPDTNVTFNIKGNYKEAAEHTDQSGNKTWKLAEKDDKNRRRIIDCDVYALEAMKFFGEDGKEIEKWGKKNSIDYNNNNTFRGKKYDYSIINFIGRTEIGQALTSEAHSALIIHEKKGEKRHWLVDNSFIMQVHSGGKPTKGELSTDDLVHIMRLVVSIHKDGNKNNLPNGDVIVTYNGKSVKRRYVNNEIKEENDNTNSLKQPSFSSREDIKKALGISGKLHSNL